MTLNGKEVRICFISPNSIVLHADHITVVDTPMMSTKYRLPVLW